MSTTTVILLIAGIACYVGFVAFVLALLTVAGRSGEAAEQHARDLALRTEPSGEVGDGEFTAGLTSNFLEGLAAREVEDVERRAMR